MHEFIVTAITEAGYVGIFILMALENVFPPLPSEVIMGVAGMAVARGEMGFWPLMLSGTAGTVLGNYVWYWLGAHWGRHRLEGFVARCGRWLTMEWEDVEQARAIFRRHGIWVVFVFRFLPILRTLISLPAGLAHMKRWQFLVFTFAGAFIWNFLLVEGGRLLGSWMEGSEQVLGGIVVGLFVLSVAIYVWRVIRWKPRADR